MHQLFLSGYVMTLHFTAGITYPGQAKPKSNGNIFFY